MRNGILMTLLMWCSFSYTQTILKHEKKIDCALNYQSREINFINYTDNTLLSGNLVLPKSNYETIVILIPGSGKDTRHSHHLLVTQLLKQNIAVYRFDDRGVGKSKGQFSNSVEDLASDVTYAYKKIKNLNESKNKKIGLIGHSLGGMATILASENIHVDPSFTIQIASPVDSFIETVKYQIKTLPHLKVENLSLDETNALLKDLIHILKTNSNSSISDVLQKGYSLIKQRKIDPNHVRFWSYNHIKLYAYQLESLYKKTEAPMLYMIGSKDLYINKKNEIEILKKIDNSNLSIKVLEGLNHYLVKDKNNKNIYEIDKTASDYITQWISSI